MATQPTPRQTVEGKTQQGEQVTGAVAAALAAGNAVTTTAVPAGEVEDPRQRQVRRPGQGNSAIKIGSVTTKRWLKMLVYGPPGAGKTRWASTALDVPEMQDVLILDPDLGVLSASDRDDLDVIEVNKWSDIARAKEFLALHLNARDKGNEERLRTLQDHYMNDTLRNPERLRRYRTVIIDTFSEAAKQVMGQLMGAEIGDVTLDEIPDSPEYKEWNQNTNMLRAAVREFRAMPIHLILTCHEKMMEVDKRKFRTPDISGQLARGVQGLVDIVGYLRTVQPAAEPGKKPPAPVRRLYLQPSGGFDAKNRIPGMDDVPYLNNSSVKDLYTALNKKRETAG